MILGLAGAGVFALLAILLLRFMAGLQTAVTQDKLMTASFVADPNNKTSLSVRGWNRPELAKILTDFRRLYDLPEASEWVIEEKSGDVFTVTFPRDIQPKLFLFLVNYCRYPKDLDLNGRSIGVLGRAVLTAAYGVPDDSLIGKEAEIYVPADDIEYDEVYARVERGEAYRIPFTNLIWKAASEARVPAEIAGL
jgi:hypothetical protein